MLDNPDHNTQPDTFICHASEDKESIARPLAQALKGLGINAWLDEFEIRLGDSIRRKIDQGLATTTSATVILSRPFFSKNWTQYELDGIIERHIQGEIALIPIWHAITRDEIRNHSPSIVDIFALNSSEQTIEQMAASIAEQIRPTHSGMEAQADTETAAMPPAAITGPAFGVFYIAPKGTPELLPGSEPDWNPMMSFTEPTGWIPMLHDNQELEYVVNGDILRVRLDWGKQWQGSEMQAHGMTSGNEPFAITIRPTGGPQIHFPSLVNQYPKRIFSTQSSRSGWMTFLIQGH